MDSTYQTYLALGRKPQGKVTIIITAGQMGGLKDVSTMSWWWGRQYAGFHCQYVCLGKQQCHIHPLLTPQKYAFLACGHLDFESTVSAQNGEFKTSFDSLSLHSAL